MPSRSARAVAAPAARRRRRRALAERVVEEAEEGDPEQVGQPAPQVGVEQVEVGAVVEEGERRQRHQRRRRQHRPEREGERARRGSSPAPARRRAARAPRPAPAAARARSPAGSPTQYTLRRPWVSRSGSSRSALPLTPKLPSAPSSAKTIASLPGGHVDVVDAGEVVAPGRRRSRTGRASEVSTPTAGVRVAVIPLSRPLSSWPVGGRAGPGPCPPAGCGRRSPRRGAPKLPLAREKRWPRTTSGRVPPRTSWRPTPVAERGQRVGVVAQMSAKRVFARSPARPLRSTGSRTTPTPTSFAPVGASASSTAAGDLARQAAEGDDRDPLALQPVAGQDRVDAVGELVRSGRARRSVRRLLRAGVLEVADEAVPRGSRRVLVSASPPNSAPIRIPIASARKTAISEVAW